MSNIDVQRILLNPPTTDLPTTGNPHPLTNRLTDYRPTNSPIQYLQTHRQESISKT